MDNIITFDTKLFPLTKYKNWTYKQVFETNDDKYFKYLIDKLKCIYHF